MEVSKNQRRTTMNNTTEIPENTLTTIVRRPKLTFYHPNAKGTGSAIEFELHPAHDDTAGSIFARIARQKTVGSNDNGTRTFATFDWSNSITVKLDISDLSNMMMVFRGIQESINNGKGLLHNSAKGLTIISLDHRIEPTTGYWLNISRKSANGSDHIGIGFLLKPAEAMTLTLAIEQSYSIIAFGIPMVLH